MDYFFVYLEEDEGFFEIVFGERYDVVGGGGFDFLVCFVFVGDCCMDLLMGEEVIEVMER